MAASKHLSSKHLQFCVVDTPGCGIRSYSQWINKEE
jgi:hypothetical protein